MYRPLLVLALVVGGMVFLQFEQSGIPLRGGHGGGHCPAISCGDCLCTPGTDPECYSSYDECMEGGGGNVKDWYQGGSDADCVSDAQCESWGVYTCYATEDECNTANSLSGGGANDSVTNCDPIDFGLYQTGYGTTGCETDPNWGMKVASTINGNWTTEIQWLSDECNGGSPQPPGTWTASTTFSIPSDTDLSLLSITGKAAADNQITSITLNGTTIGSCIPTGPYDLSCFSGLTDFSLTDALVIGANTIEFTLYNFPRPSSSYPDNPRGWGAKFTCNFAPAPPATCGNDEVETGEECDDNNTDNNDGCSSSCQDEECGDGIEQTSEECDNGGSNSDSIANACRTSCEDAGCGDGVEDTGEECDDNNTDNNDGCSSSCQDEECGDGIEQTNEECDDDNTANNDGCSSSCKDEVCGDGIEQTSEECDAGSNNSEDPDASCRTNCEDAGCGDGVEDTGEECDDGNTVDTDNCKNNCTEPEAVCTRCGDECTDLPPETIDCDEPTPTINIECAFENNVCTKTLLPFCGDGTKEDPEECDYGAANNTEFSIATDGCAFDCTAVQGLCTGDSDCAQAPGEDFLCLGPVTQDTEIVHYKKNDGDPDNIIYTVLEGECYYEAAGCEKDACIMHKIYSCDCPQVEEAIICGDGDKEGDEECDDGNNVDDDGCSSSCFIDTVSTCSACGNTCVMQPDCAETTENFTCVDDNGNCERVDSICGNGEVETGEECDDGNIVNGDGCSSTCLTEIEDEPDPTCSACGNNCVIFPPNNCTPGNSCMDCAEQTEDFGCAMNGSVCEKTASLCGNGALDAGEECDGTFDDACTGADYCLERCECGWEDADFCHNSPDLCCVSGSSQRCCTSGFAVATLCWPVGQEPPPEACDAIDPSFVCNVCSSTADCRATEECDSVKCTLMKIADAWQSGEGQPPAVFNSAIGHSVVVFNQKLWDVFQDRDSIVSSNNVASGGESLWQEEGAIFAGTPSLDEFTHVVFNNKQWIIGGTDYSGAPRRTRDVWSSSDGVIWQKHSNVLPAQIDRHASVVFHNKMWILGGSQGGTSASDVIYVSENGTVWTPQLSRLPVGLSYAEAVVYKDEIVLLGGSLEDGSVSNKVWKSTDGMTWAEVGVNALAGKNFSNRSAAVFNNAIWIVGNHQTNQPTTFYSEDSGENWMAGPMPTTNVFGGTDLVKLNDNTLVLVGGYDNATPSQADIVQFLTITPRGSCNPTIFTPKYTCSEISDTGGTSGGGTTGGGTTGGGSTGGGTTGGSGYDRLRCGDGLIQGREACDDGNNKSRDGCSSTCEIENIHAAAPSITTTGQSALRLAARINGCGNGIVEPNKGEQCDDSNTVNGDGCSDLCKGELQLLLRSGSTCGNSLREEGEECDTGTKNSDTEKNSCRTDCTSAHCGDFVQDNGEECDNGPANSDDQKDACRTTCRLSACKDGVIDSGEECDDGNIQNGDGCSSTCSSEEALFASASVCGDGVLAAPEECDDANRRDSDGCNAVCQLEIGICGDGIVQELLGEQCESSLHDVSVGYACSDCQFFSVSCGDGTVDLGETCDEGIENSDTADAACRTNCHMARCGDSVVDSEEECDDGNRLNNDGCDWLCAEESETLVLGTQIDFGEDPSLLLPTSPTQVAADSQPATRNPQLYNFPQYPNYQQLPYQLPLAQLRPLIQAQGPMGDTGPAAVAVVASGMAAGFGWIRRKKR